MYVLGRGSGGRADLYLRCRFYYSASNTSAHSGKKKESVSWAISKKLEGMRTYIRVWNRRA
jgi:hypothetical protein